MNWPPLWRNVMPGNRHTQEVLFSKTAGWTQTTARKWLRDHAESFHGGQYASTGIAETADYFMAKQANKNEAEFRYVNEVIERTRGRHSIILVLGYPRGSNKAEDQWSQAQNVGDSEMSLTAKIVELEATIAQLQASLAAKDGEKAEALKVAEGQKVSELKALSDQLQAEKTAHEASKTAAATVATKHAEAVAKLEADKLALSKSVESLTKDLEKHKAALINPAMQAAAVPGRKEAVSDATVDTAKEPEKKVSRLAEYRAESRPMARTALWNRYAKEIKAELAAEYKASK